MKVYKKIEDVLKEAQSMGLLDYKKRDIVKNNDQRLVDSFLEINKFYRKNGRKPEKTSDMAERNLFATLKGIRENSKKISFLKKYDDFNLLDNIKEKAEIKSVDDIFNNDPLGILGDNKIDIFTLKNIPKIKKDRADADFVSKREKCKDFEKYENIFKQCQSELLSGERKLVESIEAELKPGSFCVLDGVLLYIVDIYGPVRGNSMKLNRRTKIVFENGTTSSMLLRSLGKRLKDSGKMVTFLDSDNDLINKILKEDVGTGYIYILKSLSSDDRIVTIKNLYKIGFSSGPVKDRIKNAEKDPTYLMAPVAIVSSFKTLNMNPQKLEKILHQFFGNSRLNIEILDKNKKPYSPTEWFIAPLDTIETAIEMIVNGSILNYRYDADSEEIKIIEK